MRSVLRPISAVLSAVALTSCVDLFQSTSPGSGRAALAIVPRFSESASLASATLAQAGIEYNRVRIVIVRPQTPPTPTDTLKDTTIVFTPTSAQVTLELAIVAIPTEALRAHVEFRQENTVMFSGTANVTALPPTASRATTPVEVEVNFVGVGSTATSVAITPGPGTYSSNNPTQFTARAFAGTAEIAGAPIFWSVSDESKATISATGLLTPKGQRGSILVTARAPTGVFQSIGVQLAPAAAGLRVIQGAGQKGPPGTNLPLPVIVELIAPDGQPAAGSGQTVTFSASGTAQVTPATVAIDANGRAQATMRVGTTAGTTYIFTATSGAFSVSWGGSASVGTPTHFVPSGSTTLTLQAGVVPNPIPTLRVADAQENSVPGVPLKVTISEGAVVKATLNGVPADSIGLLEVYKVAPEKAGTYTVLIEADPSLAIPSITYNVTITAGPAAKLAFSQQPPASVVSGSTGTLKVEIRDRFDNLVTAAAPSNVNLSIDPAGQTGWNIFGTGSVAPVAGVATFNVQINTTSGAKTGVKIQAVGANLPPVLSTPFNITLPP